jgi:hypothetical protein
MDQTTFRSTFQGKVEEKTDKVYFRKRDEVNLYSEAYFKSKGMLGNKK